MSRGRYIQHVTLQTGHSRRTYRDEVADPDIRAATDALDRSKHERVRLPQLGPEYALTASWEGHNAMLCTIWLGQAPVVTFGVARNSRASAGLWRILLRQKVGAPIVMDESSRPEPPWIAARIEVGAALAGPEQMMAIGGMESVIAFAWLEMGDGET